MVKKRQLGTTTAITGAVDTPRVTLDPKQQFPQQTAFPELQNLKAPSTAQTTPESAATGAPSLSKRQLGNFQTEYRIGDKVVSQAQYEDARSIMRGEAGYVSPQLREEMAGLGVQPFASEMQKQAEREALVQRIGAEPQAQAIDPATGQPMQQQGQLKPLDWQQVALYAATDPQSLKEIGTWVGGAAIGAKMLTAAKGAAVTGNPYIIGAAAIGALALGIYSSVRTNIKNQRTDDIKAQLAISRDAEKWKNQLIGLANTDPDNAETYLGAFQELDNKQRDAWYKLEQASRNNLNLALGEDATIELQRFRNYYQAGGGYDVQNTKLQLAIATPNFEQGMRGLLASSQSITGAD